MAVDTSYTSTKDSDSKVCTLMGVNKDNELFVFDMWSQQCQQQKLIDAVLQMADKWRCPTVHVEGIKEGLSVYDTLYSIVSTRASDMANVDHLPRIKKFNPGMTSKSAKIAALLRRFDYGKIKIPLRDRHRKPWRALIDQIEQDRARGVPAWDAIIGAAVRRFRPIVLTAAAAVLAMIPLSRSVFWGPMAVAIMGGLIVATGLTLLALPAMYAAWFRVRRP